MRWVLALALAGCAAGVDALPPSPAADPFDDPKADRLVLTHVAVVGDLAPGQTSAAIRYQDPPLYTALRFGAPAGQEVDLVVHSDDGDGFVRLLDARFAVVATARAVGPDATLRVTLADADPVHYIAFRDHERRDATFTVTWRDAGLFPGLRDAALVAALKGEMEDGKSVGYAAARRAMFETTTGLDMVGGAATCVYTGTRAAGDGSPTPPGMSIEHVWPQSRGSELEPMKSDLHHLLPATVSANSARNDHHYGETRCGTEGQPRCEWEGGGSVLGRDAAGALIFMPRPERRGDVARATFYFAVRYGLHVDDGEEALLKAWNDADPPDEAERARMQAVQTRQGNRNLFVDDPGLARRIADL